MDKLTRYREIIRQLIFEYAGHKPANGQIDTEAVIDSERDHYEVVHVGWDGVRRVHGSIVHIDIINNKVWIQYDGTSEPVAEALLAAGIPHEDIVLGFHPEELRQYTDFAIS
ncbi:XisI protein [Nostoc sp. FACHB-87]|uniref:XisI protein n=1 Tax=Nostocaceae TaxID=1162 RepID=UPI0016887AE6|nr:MULTISPECIES: XisI protein [Nostocaceae]MBD2454676.1 XisI protein [Nostoc sp. FACHB-87]MBD2475905.1 XisI protein [Anabaena sp. FACHB-83]